MTTTEELADLLGRVTLRDRAAFRRLYEASSAKLFGVLLRILGNRAEAEDALQEVYVKVWRKASAYRPQSGAAITWMAAIARNHAIDVVRARRPSAADIDAASDIADPAPNPEQNAHVSSERVRIETCLAELKDGRAEAVRGAYVNGDSYEELAARFSVPLNTMRTWLRRSLIQLRECLER